MKILRLGSRGPEVRQLQEALRDAGFNPGSTDGDFGERTDAAVRAFQSSEGLLADGVVGSRTWECLLGERVVERPDELAAFTPALTAKMFPFTPLANISANLPCVLDGLRGFDLTSSSMALMALATIRAEVEEFRPVPERPSKYNTSPGGHPFDLYDNRRDLGNRGAPDGFAYRGRGYVQLTGRDNYRTIGEAVGADLEGDPDLACRPVLAGKILAAFLSSKEVAIKRALLEGDLRHARRLINGGSHGLDRFEDAYRRGVHFIVEGAS